MLFVKSTTVFISNHVFIGYVDVKKIVAPPPFWKEIFPVASICTSKLHVVPGVFSAWKLKYAPVPWLTKKFAENSKSPIVYGVPEPKGSTTSCGPPAPTASKYKEKSPEFDNILVTSASSP